jgi:hypothetical protein
MPPVGLRCQQCDIVVNKSWAWIWHPERFSVGAGREVIRWLCPDCSGQFGSNAERRAFLEKTLGAKKHDRK